MVSKSAFFCWRWLALFLGAPVAVDFLLPPSLSPPAAAVVVGLWDSREMKFSNEWRKVVNWS